MNFPTSESVGAFRRTAGSAPARLRSAGAVDAELGGWPGGEAGGADEATALRAVSVITGDKALSGGFELAGGGGEGCTSPGDPRPLRREWGALGIVLIVGGAVGAVAQEFGERGFQASDLEAGLCLALCEQRVEEA